MLEDKEFKMSGLTNCPTSVTELLGDLQDSAWKGNCGLYMVVTQLDLPLHNSKASLIYTVTFRDNKQK